MDTFWFKRIVWEVWFFWTSFNDVFPDWSFWLDPWCYVGCGDILEWWGSKTRALPSVITPTRTCPRVNATRRSVFTIQITFSSYRGSCSAINIQLFLSLNSVILNTRSFTVNLHFVSCIPNLFKYTYRLLTEYRDIYRPGLLGGKADRYCEVRFRATT